MGANASSCHSVSSSGLSLRGSKKRNKGGAASSSSSKSTGFDDVAVRTGAAASESFRRPSWIMVMNMLTGEIKEYRQPIPAISVVVSENNNSNSNSNNYYYLSNAESMCIGTCMPRVPDEEELLPGRIYFLVPISHSHYPLSLPLLCDLAVKASSALAS